MPPLQRHPVPRSPVQQARIDKLAALDGLAAQILSMLAGMSHNEIGEMLFGPPSQSKSEYQALKARFNQAKHIYLPVPGTHFIFPQAVGLTEPAHVDVLRRTNMATFMASIFSGEIGLRIMDINFVEIFVPENGRLLKAQASIYLELKTQAFIAAKRTRPDIVNQAMLELFPSDMEKHLLAKRPGAKSLAPSEHDFLKRLKSRRDILYADIRNNRLGSLESRYRWDDFSREVYSYLSKNHDQADSGSKDKSEQPSPGPGRVKLQQNQMQGQFTVSSQSLSQTGIDSTAISTADADFDLGFDIDSFVAKAARAAELAMQGRSTPSHDPTQSSGQTMEEQQPPHPPRGNSNPMANDHQASVVSPPQITSLMGQKREATAQSRHTEFQQYQPVPPSNDVDSAESDSNLNDGDVPHKSQTAPTQVLYERARLVTTAKVLPTVRKPNPPSHRRPWTNEEENALMTGLDQVKGPHWSQILAMYGPGGTINESLKDRNQVQLKDKARNLKLFFLKAGIEVPYYLQAVTGDLKTRAPGQAEKREAKERERCNVDGEDPGLQQDEAQVELAEDTDTLLEPGSQHDESVILPMGAGIVSHEQQTNLADDFRSPTTRHGDSDETSRLAHATTGSEGELEEDSFDMEAMLARAAASVTQSLGNGWP